MHSCVYEGTVRHRRNEPVKHAFQYRIYLAWLDLSETDSLREAGLLPRGRFSANAFRRSDHLFQPELSLQQELRAWIAERTGDAPTGPIRLLTQFRNWGYYFSPLSLYFVYDAADSHVEMVVAEVNNTPWRERHCYLLHDANRIPSANGLQFAHPKSFHVSPFMPMHMQYRWRLSSPGDTLNVCLANWRENREVFTASLALRKRPLTRSCLRASAIRFPLMAAKVSSAIYFQALKLWWKKCPTYAHPKTRVIAC